MIFEGLRNALLKFFRACHYDAQAAEGLGGNAARVGIEKCGGGKKHGDGVFTDQRGNGAGIQRARMINDADADDARQAERAGETERMKEGKNAEDAVFRFEMEDLFDLLDVGREIKVRKDDAFWFAGGGAGENDSCGVVEGKLFGNAEREFDQARRK